jgi:hypothetical protein
MKNLSTRSIAMRARAKLKKSMANMFISSVLAGTARAEKKKMSWAYGNWRNEEKNVSSVL